MSKFNSNKVMPRYFVIVLTLTIIGIAIIGKALYIMTVQKDYWMTVQQQMKHDSIPMPPNRGNILSCDGQLMASSIPEYRVYIDFQPGREKDAPWDTASINRVDRMWAENIDSLCKGLSDIFRDKTPEEFKTYLLEGKGKVGRDGTVGHRNYPVVKRRIDYNTFTLLRKLPIFNLPKGKGGFHWETLNARNRPFGSLAKRTVGVMYGDKDLPRVLR